MRRLSLAVAAAAVLLSAVVAGVSSQGTENRCQEQRLCRECIQTVGCVWCVNPLEGANCQHVSVNISSFCNLADLQDPKKALELVRNEELTGTKEDRKQTDEIIQLKPQRVKLYLRKDVPQFVNITYRRARGYPVDLYYLMDLSNSMSDDKENLAKVGSELANTMRNLTSQFTLGFGSFVDKVMMPFTNTTQLHKAKPCENCAFPYSFRNDMKLSQDYNQFTTRVREAEISGNLDHPEGGFDALMQAMVCKERIGWRDVARHILVFSTDAKFHHAGDGRLAGVVEPNDEQCHLDENEEYTAFDKYDYPSIGQINKVANEKKINIIFAVLTNAKLYRSLSERVTTSSFGLLEKGSSNVVDLIEKQYNSISSTVTLLDNSTSDINIKYRTSCKGGPLNNTGSCKGIHEGDDVVFQLEITAETCPADGKRSIVEVKTLEDTVILDIEFLCSCNCSGASNPGNLKCQNGGLLRCGVCECLPGFSGDQCQCGTDDDSYSDDESQNSKCMLSNKDTKLCSGRGTCRCGRCECKNPEEVSGHYCECNKRKCLGPKGDLCSNHGKCDCNKCRCEQGYSGAHCECEDSACYPPGSNKICSGHGTCDCGRCNCGQDGNVTYTGQYCEDCLSCGSGKCQKFKDCVQCTHFGIGPLKHDCSACPPSIPVDVLDEHMEKDSHRCTFEDEEGCYLNFAYRYLEASKTDEVFVQLKRQCPEPAPILSIVFSLIGVIVGIGVLTLILWKVFTTIHDRREYARFVKETEHTRFPAEENPLYRGAVTTTQNPMFDTQQVK